MTGPLYPDRSTRKNVLAFGEILWDILPDRTVLGGAPFNFVYRINSIGDCGLMVSRIGQDARGDAALAKIRELALDDSCVQLDETHPTGWVDVTFDAGKNPSYVINPGVAYDHIEITEILQCRAAVADCICFGTLAQRAETSRHTLQWLLDSNPGALKVVDINLRRDCYTRDTIESSLRRADILKINEDEAAWLSRHYLNCSPVLPTLGEWLICHWNLQAVFVTLDERGVFGLESGGMPVHVPGHRIALVDPLGAGDAFLAGAVHCLLRGGAFTDACVFGNILGALTAATAGATTPIDESDIGRLYKSTGARNADERFVEYAV